MHLHIREQIIHQSALSQQLRCYQNLHEAPVLGRAATRLGASCVPAKEVIVKACTEASAAKHTATAAFIVLAEVSKERQSVRSGRQLGAADQHGRCVLQCSPVLSAQRQLMFTLHNLCSELQPEAVENVCLQHGRRLAA
jgi:hypothetical protein